MTAKEALKILSGDFSYITLRGGESHADVYVEAFVMACDRDNMEPVQNIHKPKDPYTDVPVGNCNTRGKIVSMDDIFCSRCEQRLDWRQV